MATHERQKCKEHRGWHSRGYLPHFDSPYVMQMITFRLADSLPKSILREIETETMHQTNRQKRMRIDKHLDASHGKCYLLDKEIAKIVEEALFHFDTERYFLLAWVIMPNHVHVLVEIKDGYILSDLLHSWKRFTARLINHKLGSKGRLWQPEYWDRCIRDEKHLANAINYIHMNPVKAGFIRNPEEWQFSSAWRRQDRSKRRGLISVSPSFK